MLHDGAQSAIHGVPLSYSDNTRHALVVELNAVEARDSLLVFPMGIESVSLVKQSSLFRSLNLVSHAATVVSTRVNGTDVVTRATLATETRSMRGFVSGALPSLTGVLEETRSYVATMLKLTPRNHALVTL
jgi:hypothetical protein